MQPQAGGRYRFGVFELDRVAIELRKRGVLIKLQDQPFRILCALLDAHGEIVSRDALKAVLWPEDTFVEFERGMNAAGGAAYWLGRGRARLEPPLVAVPLTAYPGFESNPSFSPDGNQVAFS